ncbi:MAG: IreB family regulatory phosphoprotein [Lachnospiraceae bacterium]|nr:IreB family regulatory phosphoprotein [Lachnospiraceae bacterium]
MISARMIEVLDNAYITMKEYSYDAYSQFLGYLITGDITYITSKNNARMRMLEFERDEILELMLEIFFDTQPMNEYSGRSYSAAKSLIFVYQTMRSAGYDPVRQIIGYLVTDDASYVSVKNGARNEISSHTVKEYCDVLIRAYISSRREMY